MVVNKERDLFTEESSKSLLSLTIDGFEFNISGRYFQDVKNLPASQSRCVCVSLFILFARILKIDLA